MKRILLGLALSLIAAAASADNLTNAIRAQLVQPAVLRGQFEQTKQVVGFKKALRSSGNFLVAQNRGVLWNTQTPFMSQLKLTRTEIVASQDGQIAFRLNASKEPSVRIINSLMFSLLSGNVSELARQFKVAGSSNRQGWKLQLTPLPTGLEKVMSQISLSGDKYVRSIDINETSGDKTHIRFVMQTASQTPLNAKESAQFD